MDDANVDGRAAIADHELRRALLGDLGGVECARDFDDREHRIVGRADENEGFGKWFDAAEIAGGFEGAQARRGQRQQGADQLIAQVGGAAEREDRTSLLRRAG